MMRRYPGLRMGLAAIIGIVTALSSGVAASQAPPADGLVTEVRGLLSARYRTTLSSQVAGPIVELQVEAGDRFEHGAVLFRIDCRLFEAQRAVAVASLAGEHRLLGFQQALERLGTGNERDRARAEIAVARATAELARLDLTVSLCETRAPFAGQVVERKAQRFEHVRSGQAVLDILDDRSLEVTMIVPSFWLSWLRRGVRFEMRVDETRSLVAGEVVRLGALIDPASQSLRIYGQPLQPPASLVAGMSGTVRFADSGSTRSAAPLIDRPPATPAVVARPTWTVEEGVARPDWTVTTPGSGLP